MIEGLPTLLEAIDAAYAAKGSATRGDGTIAPHLAATLPVDGTPDRWLGMGARGTAMTVRMTGPTGDGSKGIEPAAIAAMGVPVGSTTRGSWITVFSDIVVAMVPDERIGTFQLSGVKLARPGDERLDLAGLARLVDDEWLDDGDPRLRIPRPSQDPGIAPLMRIARGVQLAERGRDVGDLALVSPTPDGSRKGKVVALRGRRAPSPRDLAWEVLEGVAERLPPRESWDANPLGCRRLAGCWTEGRLRTHVPFDPPRLSFLRERVAWDAGVALADAMEAAGWPTEMVGRARARWTLRGNGE